MNPRRRNHRFLSLPIRRSLEGVSWASLSVRWTPTEDQKQRRRQEMESLWLPGEREERRPGLHPLGGRRFPFERFYSRMSRAGSSGQARAFSHTANTDGFRSSPAEPAPDFTAKNAPSPV